MDIVNVLDRSIWFQPKKPSLQMHQLSVSGIQMEQSLGITPVSLDIKRENLDIMTFIQLLFQPVNK